MKVDNHVVLIILSCGYQALMLPSVLEEKPAGGHFDVCRCVNLKELLLPHATTAKAPKIKKQQSARNDEGEWQMAVVTTCGTIPY